MTSRQYSYIGESIALPNQQLLIASPKKFILTTNTDIITIDSTHTIFLNSYPSLTNVRNLRSIMVENIIIIAKNSGGVLPLPVFPILKSDADWFINVVIGAGILSQTQVGNGSMETLLCTIDMRRIFFGDDNYHNSSLDDLNRAQMLIVSTVYQWTQPPLSQFNENYPQLSEWPVRFTALNSDTDTVWLQFFRFSLTCRAY
jgi:hypothetical protein